MMERKRERETIRRSGRVESQHVKTKRDISPHVHVLVSVRAYSGNLIGGGLKSHEIVSP